MTHIGQMSYKRKRGRENTAGAPIRVLPAANVVSNDTKVTWRRERALGSEDILTVPLIAGKYIHFHIMDTNTI